MRWSYKHLLRVLAEVRKSGFEMQAKWQWAWQIDGERFKEWDGAPIKSVLDAMGREGWEMITANRLEGDATEYYFKKLMPANAKPEPVVVPKGPPVLMPSPVRFAKHLQGAAAAAAELETPPVSQEPAPSEAANSSTPTAEPAKEDSKGSTAAVPPADQA